MGANSSCRWFQELVIAKFKSRYRWIKRQRAFRRAIAEAAQGKIKLMPFPAAVAPPLLEITRGAQISDPQLRALLRDEKLGQWAFDAATLALLEFLFERDQPREVLEFGAGVSTLALAFWMKRKWGNEQTRVFSVEQNQWQIDWTRERLRAHHLENMVELLHAPLNKQTFFDVEAEFYHFSDFCLIALERANPDWILVDGPAGDDLVRYGTLAQLEKLVSAGAIWFLDDAMRDEERAVLQAWMRLPFLKVEGTYPVGKGLARGRFVATN